MKINSINSPNSKISFFCIPGFLGSSRDWDQVFSNQRETSVKVHSPDLFGRENGLKPEAFNLPSLGARINTMAREVPGPRVLVGYSLGGRIALHSFLQGLQQAPGFWAGAVIISAHPGLTHESEKKARLLNDEIWAKKFESVQKASQWNEVLREWNSQEVFRGSTQASVQRSFEDYSSSLLAAALRGCSLGLQEDFREPLKKVCTPLLWVVGEKDQKFLNLAKEVELLNPNWIQVKVISDAGHRVLWDQPQSLMALVEKFLEGVGD